MAIYCVLGVLAAFGALCVLWAAFGWLLPWRGCSVVCLYRSVEDARLASLCCGWLHGLGLIKAPLLLVGSGLSETEQARLSHPYVEFCTPEALASKLEQERDKID